MLNNLLPGERCILRRVEVEAKTGLRRSQLYALLNRGSFPKPVRLGSRAVGWDSDEVEQWIAKRFADRR